MKRLLTLCGCMVFFSFIVNHSAFSWSASFSTPSESDHTLNLSVQEKTLSEIMKAMDLLWLPIGRAIIRKDFNTETLENLAEFQNLTHSVIVLTPSFIDQLPEFEKRAMQLEYAQMMTEVLSLSYQLEVFYTDQNFTDALSTYRAIQDLKTKGHDRFKGLVIESTTD